MTSETTININHGVGENKHHFEWCPKCKMTLGKDALHCSRCGSATDITVALKEEELQKTALKSAIDPEYISKLVDALVEEKLKQKEGS